MHFRFDFMARRRIKRKHKYRRAFTRLGGPRYHLRAKGDAHRKWTWGRKTYIRRPIGLPGIGAKKQYVTFEACGFKALAAPAANKKLSLLDLNITSLFDWSGDMSATLQPMGIDEWFNFYNKWRTTRVVAKVTFSKAPTSAIMSTALAAGVMVTQSAADIVDTDLVSTVCEFFRSRFRVMMAADTAGTATSVRGFKVVVNPTSLFDSPVSTGDYNQTGSANPTNNPILIIWIGRLDDADLATVTHGDVFVKVRISGYFFDRKQLTASVQ